MAFWALGKVKNITQKLNLKEYKDYGSKIIKNYMHKQDQNEQFFDFVQNGSDMKQQHRATDKQTLSEAQWLQIQFQQYKKLSKLQERLLKRHQQQEQKKLAKQYEQLQNQLIQLSKEEQKQIETIQKQKLKSQIKMGQKNMTELIKQNILMRQEIQKRKIIQ